MNVFEWKLVSRGYLGRWSRICRQISKIWNIKSNIDEKTLNSADEVVVHFPKIQIESQYLFDFKKKLQDRLVSQEEIIEQWKWPFGDISRHVFWHSSRNSLKRSIEDQIFNFFFQFLYHVTLFMRYFFEYRRRKSLSMLWIMSAVRSFRTSVLFYYFYFDMLDERKIYKTLKYA